MSQRGPAPHTAPRRSSRSPSGHDAGSPRQHVQLPGSNDGRRPASTSVTSTEGGGRSQDLPPKALGVHNILNPFEPRLMASEGSVPPLSRPGEGEGAPIATSARTYGGGARPFFPNRMGPSSHPGTPIGSLTSLGRPPSSGRNSPATAYQFPGMNDTRNVVSPRQPRSSSLSQGVLPREMDSRAQSHLPPSSPAKRLYEKETPEELRAVPGLHHASGMPFTAHHSVGTSPRAMALPASRPADAPYMPASAVVARDPHGRPQSLHALPSQFHHGAAINRPMSAIGGSGDGLSSWSEVMRRSGMSGAMGGAEGQQAFMTLPGSDVPIPVQVDYSQASKKADEKRQRNAKASTRHRRKKKTLQEENMRQLQDLKDEREQLAHEVEDLKQQRDFYRDERNRLRDIVARTPGIHQHAAGPPTPLPRSPESHEDMSPGAHSHMQTPTPGYASDLSSVERPGRRRRTEDRPEYSTPVFGTPAGGPPPILAPGPGGQAYGVPPRPLSAASSTSGERLPPLRALEGAPPVQSHGPGHAHAQHAHAQHAHAHEQDPRTGQWRPAQPRHFETGWATAPRKPHHEGHTPQWQ
ncbi:hypothetical protein TOPH_07412 [Tolypocladium ophioglossoides CBS 100239]|uniref:BZIP domain-containing protein n=1 Tax=Tolypocladium ophioglossoides (strain CBS 100239) TaxID=1163406 RepID=A0A0L0N289_TOLOC|nr:hypothetical protein TOPH_07412 [Tolypocladium ophioglossoides CBS 100239]